MSTEPLVLVLTEEQASKLRGALDLATKAGGLQVAAVMVELDTLILAADAKRKEPPATPVSAAEVPAA